VGYGLPFVIVHGFIDFVRHAQAAARPATKGHKSDCAYTVTGKAFPPDWLGDLPAGPTRS